MPRKKKSATEGTWVVVRHPDGTEDSYRCGDNDVVLAADDGKRTLMLISASPVFVANMIAKTTENNPDHRAMFAAAVMLGMKPKDGRKARLKKP